MLTHALRTPISVYMHDRAKGLVSIGDYGQDYAGAPLPVSDWPVVRIYPRFLRPIGPQCARWCAC
eukprot:5680277-Pyramimonas_sp.AAC.1